MLSNTMISKDPHFPMLKSKSKFEAKQLTKVKDCPHNVPIALKESDSRNRCKRTNPTRII